MWVASGGEAHMGDRRVGEASMVRRWERWRNPWDREYARRGRLWRGAASLDPLPRVAPPPRRVVEVGCGDGKFLSSLARAGYQCLGVDLSRRALQLLPHSPRADRVLGDIRRLPLKEGAAPVVAARYLLASLRARERDLAALELVRALPGGGLLLVEEFTREDFRYGSGRLVEPATFERNAGILTHYFDESELRALLPGLVVEETVRTGGRLRIWGRTYARAAVRILFRRPK